MTKLRRWMMLSLVAPVLLLSACGSDSATTPTPTPTPTPISVNGAWSMTANTSYKFTLTITQAGAAITGTMHCITPAGADTLIDGGFDGTNIIFTRHLPATRTVASSTQVYTGIVSAAGSALSGTFTAAGSTKTYPWSAAR
jgi:hypothetical protein